MRSSSRERSEQEVVRVILFVIENKFGSLLSRVQERRFVQGGGVVRGEDS
jgi:hypothetical protein